MNRRDWIVVAALTVAVTLGLVLALVVFPTPVKLGGACPHSGFGCPIPTIPTRPVTTTPSGTVTANAFVQPASQGTGCSDSSTSTSTKVTLALASGHIFCTLRAAYASLAGTETLAVETGHYAADQCMMLNASAGTVNVVGDGGGFVSMDGQFRIGTSSSGQCPGVVSSGPPAVNVTVDSLAGNGTFVWTKAGPFITSSSTGTATNITILGGHMAPGGGCGSCVNFTLQGATIGPGCCAADGFDISATGGLAQPDNNRLVNDTFIDVAYHCADAAAPSADGVGATYSYGTFGAFGSTCADYQTNQNIFCGNPVGTNCAIPHVDCNQWSTSHNLSVIGTVYKRCATQDFFLGGTGAQHTITALTNTGPVSVTTNSSTTLATGQTVAIALTGTSLDNQTFTVTATSSTSFTLNGTTGFGGSWNGGGQEAKPYVGMTCTDKTEGCYDGTITLINDMFGNPLHPGGGCVIGRSTNTDPSFGPNSTLNMTNVSMNGQLTCSSLGRSGSHTVDNVNISNSIGAWQSFTPAGWVNPCKADTNQTVTFDHNVGSSQCSPNDLAISGGFGSVYQSITAATEDLHLKAGSPAIGYADAAVCPATDIDGQARHSVCDAGADQVSP